MTHPMIKRVKMIKMKMHKDHVILLISKTEADLFTGNQQLHETGIENDESTGDSDSEFLPDNP